ncbi:MAG: CYTH domain-containing protein [Xanthomonadales bacterium]|jgi:adenylate cyclase|nr:CYTH domain-containing protein [Xanthomonadales bacterium]
MSRAPHGHEIERKFLLSSEAWRSEVSHSARLEQGYLTAPAATEGARASVRVRSDGERAWLNIKSRTLGAIRREFEYEIPLADARVMLDGLTAGAAILKTRHYLSRGAHTFEIDEFDGENAGLIVAEVELADIDEDFERPEWLGVEVTNDARYYNVNLVTLPYSRWS